MGKVALKNQAILDKLMPALQMAENAPKDPLAVSPAGATGMYQVMPATYAMYAKKLGLPDDGITNPEHNGAVAYALMDELLSRYQGNIPLALSGYNWGQGNEKSPRTDFLAKSLGYDVVPEKLTPHLPDETSKYVTKIMASLAGDTGQA